MTRPGYSASEEQLAALEARGFNLPPAGSAGASARLLAEQHLARHPEAPQDSRLRAGSPVQHHRAEVAAALREEGFPTGNAAKFARAVESIPMDVPNIRRAAQIVAAAAKEAAPAPRSAETVVNRRV